MMPALGQELKPILAALRQFANGAYNEKPLFLWSGSPETIRGAIEAEPHLSSLLSRVDINDLAEDCLARLAAERLRDAIERRLAEAIAAGKRILLVENPWLLLRYEPASPLGSFWNRFVSSERAVVVVAPPAIARPASLPAYVQFHAEEVSARLGAGSPIAPLATPGGGP